MPKRMNRPVNNIFWVTYCYYIYGRYMSQLEYIKKNPYWLRYHKYHALIRRFHEKIVDKMIFEQYVYSMPYRLGDIFVAKKKGKIIYDENGNIDYEKTKINVDYNRTKKYGKRFLHYNNHTKGYYMRFHWRKRGGAARVKNIGIYSLNVSYPVKRKLSNAINELYVKGKIDFYELKDTRDDTHKS